MQLDQIFSLILEICRKSSGSPILVLQSELGQNSNSLCFFKMYIKVNIIVKVNLKVL